MKYYIALAACIILWGLWGFLPKVASSYIPPESILAYELAAGVVFAALVAALARPRVNLKDRSTWYAVGAGMCGVGGLLFFLLALSTEKAMIVTPLTGMYPLVTFMLGLVLLRERYNVYNYLGMAAALAAIVLLSM